MKTTPRVLVYCLTALAMNGAAYAETSPPVVTASDYDRAVRRIPEMADRYVLNAQVTPHWFGDSDQFWYRRALGGERFEFVKVNASSGARLPAFDHRQVAAGLSQALKYDVQPNQLPFKTFRYVKRHAVQFVADEALWTCSLARPHCTSVGAPPDNSSVSSPDGRWAAFLKDHNVWIRSTQGGEEFPLTTDGEEHYAYAVISGNTLGSIKDLSNPRPPVIIWSPDSRYLLTHRLDERKVREATLVQSSTLEGDGRAKSYSWRYSTAGDAHLQTIEQWVFDIDRREGKKIDLAPLEIPYMTPIEGGESWWSQDSQRLFLLTRTRYMKKMTLHSADPHTGEVRELLSEGANTFIEYGIPGSTPMIHVLASGDILWFSERDGHGHLYLYDGLTGKLKRRVTQGEWSVIGISRIDEARGEIVVRVVGKEHGDPYFNRFYRVSLNGAGPNSEMTLLTPEDADHSVTSIRDDSSAGLSANADPTEDLASSIGFSPSGRYLVDTFSRVDSPPVTVLRRSDGSLVAQIERADISALIADGLRMPERFKVLAADGETPIYGTILRPASFDPTKRYAVIDAIYGGPQTIRAFPNFTGAVFDVFAAQSYAELGFVVVLIDGRGTPGRSKAFRDAAYRKLNAAGCLDDHIAAIKQLAVRYPYMDLARVGIYGQSGGGYSTARAMFAYPDFFKVGIAAAGNHDQRGYLADWGEYYLGPDDGKLYAQTANAPLARHMKGKLFLIHGEMDTNVPPWLTMQVVDQLIKYNKDFELLIVPNASHHVLQGYALRRSWDYFVRNLMGGIPPKDYQMPQEPAAGHTDVQAQATAQ
jgi:dipeptidyl-peptidase-4